MSAVAVKKPDQQQMLEQLAEAVDIEHASQEAKQKFAQIAASIWTAEDREKGRQLGREAVSLRAKELRVLWCETAIKAVMDNYDCGNYLFRPGIIKNLHAYCVVHGLRGKGGGNIQTGTISRWLTGEVEAEVRLEAISRLVARKTT